MKTPQGNHFGPASLGLALLLSLTGHAQDATSRPGAADWRSEMEALRSRVGALESQLERERRENAERLRALEEATSRPETPLEDAIKRLDIVESSPAARSRLALSGYVDIEFRIDQAEDNPTFDQHRLVLRADTEITDRIAFKSEIEFEGGGSGEDYLSDNAITVEYAELSFDLAEWMQFKAGALLVPFGRLNTLHDSPLQELTDRPNVDRYIVPTTWTEAGVGLTGAFDLGPVTLDYDVIVSNGLDQDFASNAGGGFRDARSSYREDSNDDFMIAGRLGITPHVDFLDAMNVGLSFATEDYDAMNRRALTMLGVDWTFRKGAFELVGEYATANLERDPALANAGVPGGADGFYVQINYRFFPEFLRGTWDFFTEQSTFTLIFRYGTTDTDDSMTGIDRATRGAKMRDDIDVYTVGLNFRPVEKTVIKLEYQFLVEPDGSPDYDNDRFVMSIATYF